MRYILGRTCVFAFVLTLFFLGSGTSGQERDPHRPPCVDRACRKIESYLKSHYCGESPFGNGPDEGCEIKAPKHPQVPTKVFQGAPSESVRNILTDELHRAGLPTKTAGKVNYQVWESPTLGVVASADYSQQIGSEIDLCEVIVLIDQDSHSVVLRKSRFKRTDVDVPEVTRWTPLDLVDVNGDGKLEVVLEGDAYENHWLEVVAVNDGIVRTLFSGLGYYL